jgi:hypothetical protein
MPQTSHPQLGHRRRGPLITSGGRATMRGLLGGPRRGGCPCVLSSPCCWRRYWLVASAPRRRRETKFDAVLPRQPCRRQAAPEGSAGAAHSSLHEGSHGEFRSAARRRGPGGPAGPALLIPGVDEVFALAMPGVQGWGLVGASAASSVVLRRLIPGGVDLPAAPQKLRGQADVPSSNGPATVLQGVPRGSEGRTRHTFSSSNNHTLLAPSSLPFSRLLR